jgi:metallo-beta-lactamase family protein
MMRIQFLGGVDMVTGTQHLVESGGVRILRDCGLFQGRRKEAREINSRLPFDPKIVNAVVLSHAHIDHCGNLPSLAREGFRGPIHATTATTALCGVMLRDSAHIQEQDAAYLNQKTNRQGEEPIVPLYTLRDAEAALGLFRGYRYGEPVDLAPGLQTIFRDAGHILGAALTIFTERRNGTERRVGFAVDLGRADLPLIRDPELMEGLDALILESTYGDRLHGEAGAAEEQLREVVQRTLKRGGKVLIPSFALERTQEVVYHLASLVNAGKLPALRVYVDSPMATAISGLFEQFVEYLDDEYRSLNHRFGSVMYPEWVRYVASVEESKAVTASSDPCIIVAASGMCEHGRILHHLKHGIENSKNTVVMVGFQAQHTLGRRLLNGEKKVRIFGDWFEPRAEVVDLDAFSAHADRNDLLDYVARARPKRVFLVHGESDQREALAAALKEKNGVPVELPKPGDSVEI